MRAKLTETDLDALWAPQPGPQTEACASLADEILYGGEPGGGKTDWLLGMAITRHTRSHIFRRDAGQLAEMTDRLREITHNHGRVTESPRPVWRYRSKRVELAGLKDEADAEKWQGRAGDLKAFDEVTQFTRQQYLMVSGWGRSTVAGQRVQTLATCNPPIDEDALWVVERWAAWLDPSHPKPAKSGEIRWFAIIDGVEVECPSGDSFVTESGETIYPSSRTFVRARLADNVYLGDDYRRRIDALPEPMRTIFKTSDFAAMLQASHPFQVIPTEWVRMAQARWTAEIPEDTRGQRLKQTAIGLDVAEGGKDRTVLARRYGDYFASLEVKLGKDTPTAQASAALLTLPLLAGGYVLVDADGVGAAVYGIASERWPGRVRSYRGVKPTLWRDRSRKLEFFNTRAAAWWALRDALDPSSKRRIALPPDPDLRAELCAPRWTMSGKKIKLEDKDDIVARLGRSPDLADAVVMANWEGGTGGGMPVSIDMEFAA